MGFTCSRRSHDKNGVTITDFPGDLQLFAVSRLREKN